MPDKPAVALLLLCRGGVFQDAAFGFLDAGLLAGEVAQIEDAGAAYFTDLVQFYLLDEGGLVRENPFYAHASGNLADREGLGVGGSSTNLDNHSAEFLEPVLVSFPDPVSYGDCVAGLESRIGCSFVLGERILHKLNQIHVKNLL